MQFSYMPLELGFHLTIAFILWTFEPTHVHVVCLNSELPLIFVVKT